MTRTPPPSDPVEASHSLGRYRKRGGTHAQGWLGFERQRLEGRLLEPIPKIADPTLSEGLALREGLAWQAELEHWPYRSGELTGPAVLMCNQCGERLNFTGAGRSGSPLVPNAGEPGSIVLAMRKAPDITLSCQPGYGQVIDGIACKGLPIPASAGTHSPTGTMTGIRPT